MKSYCYICGSDSDVRECPKCGNGFCCDCFSKTKDQETGALICFDCEIDYDDDGVLIELDVDISISNRSIVHSGYGASLKTDDKTIKPFRDDELGTSLDFAKRIAAADCIDFKRITGTFPDGPVIALKRR